MLTARKPRGQTTFFAPQRRQKQDRPRGEKSCLSPVVHSRSVAALTAFSTDMLTMRTRLWPVARKPRGQTTFFAPQRRQKQDRPRSGSAVCRLASTPPRSVAALTAFSTDMPTMRTSARRAENHRGTDHAFFAPPRLKKQDRPRSEKGCLSPGVSSSSVAAVTAFSTDQVMLTMWVGLWPVARKHRGLTTFFAPQRRQKQDRPRGEKSCLSPVVSSCSVAALTVFSTQPRLLLSTRQPRGASFSLQRRLQPASSLGERA